MKIGICGKMASGKTTLATHLCEELDFEKYSLAKAVKDFANFLFDIPEGHKDRIAYQKVGDGGRKKLYENIWIDTLKNQIHDKRTNSVVVDDVRYENEVLNLKSEGWKLVKIVIDDNLQIERLKRTYPDTWETHVGSRHHASEAEVDTIADNLFDLIITAEDTLQPIEEIATFVEGVMEGGLN
jgi:broad-specificity NMP kinase